jgi:hypothetical protein
MMKSAFSKTVFTFATVLALFGLSRPAIARHSGGSKGGGGSHGRSSHGGGGGHSKGGSFKTPSFKGEGHSYRGPRGSAHISSARMVGGNKNSGQINRGSYAKAGGVSSRQFDNFGRSSTMGRGSLSSSAASRNFERFGGSESVARESPGAMGRWQSFGNSSGRTMLASARTLGNEGNGWRTFGNMGHDGAGAMSRGLGSNVRSDGQWRSFGNSRNTFIGRNISGFSSISSGRVTATIPHRTNFGSGPNRFYPNMPASTRFSSFSSFSSSHSNVNFGGSRFGGSQFGDFGFGNSSFGGSGLFSAGIGSGLSLVPNLLGGFLNLGTTLFGGPGGLAANALSLAVRLFVSGIEAGGNDQGGYNGGGAGIEQAGIGGSFGLQAARGGPACSPHAQLWVAGPAPAGYCGSFMTQPFGSSSIGYFGAPAVGFNYHW